MSGDYAAHILVVDDDDRLRQLLARFLRENGYAVTTAAEATEARTLMALFAFDLMVLDVMMPGESGLSLAQTLRKDGNALPVLMLSALADTLDRVSGLESGVDDYLTKPFEPKELLLRVSAILRRVQKPEVAQTVRFGEYHFTPANGVLLRGQETVALTTAEIAMLRAFCDKLGEPIARERLAQVAGIPADSERGVDVQITRLRRKIEPSEGSLPYLQTVRGAGYALYGEWL